jgi:hypothetical protein
MSVETYSPKKVQVIVGVALIQGFADGTFINVERSVDAFTLSVGADGEASRVHSPDRSGTITITLAQTSDSNDILSALAIADDLSLQGTIPVLVKDNNGRTLVEANTAWVKKLPAQEYSKEMSTREWVIECAELNIHVGGN